MSEFEMILKWDNGSNFINSKVQCIDNKEFCKVALCMYLHLMRKIDPNYTLQNTFGHEIK